MSALGQLLTFSFYGEPFRRYLRRSMLQRTEAQSLVYCCATTKSAAGYEALGRRALRPCFACRNFACGNACEQAYCRPFEGRVLGKDDIDRDWGEIVSHATLILERAEEDARGKCIDHLRHNTAAKIDTASGAKKERPTPTAPPRQRQCPCPARAPAWRRAARARHRLFDEARCCSDGGARGRAPGNRLGPERLRAR